MPYRPTTPERRRVYELYLAADVPYPARTGLGSAYWAGWSNAGNRRVPRGSLAYAAYAAGRDRRRALEVRR